MTDFDVIFVNDPGDCTNFACVDDCIFVLNCYCCSDRNECPNGDDDQ